MRANIEAILGDFPGQLWILSGSWLIRSIGGGLSWPFLSLYFRKELGVPMAQVGLLLALGSAASLVSQTVGGSLADKFGRKPIMAAGLFASALVTLAFGLAGSMAAFAILSLLRGLLAPLLDPALSAMVADILEPARRTRGYGLTRVAGNLGFVVGPLLGGPIASRSYPALFDTAACFTFASLLTLLFFIEETKPKGSQMRGAPRREDGGYRTILRDHPFLAFCFISVLVNVIYTQMWDILPIYIKEGYGIGESKFGLIITTNAAMIVLFQFPMARAMERFDKIRMMALGALFHAIGVGSVALSRSFPFFALDMAILTIGELILSPVSSAFVADIAPEAIRARYMGAFGLTWGLGFSIGPVVGGAIMDRAGFYLWPGMFVLGLLAMAGYLLLGRMSSLPSHPSGDSDEKDIIALVD